MTDEAGLTLAGLYLQFGDRLPDSLDGMRAVYIYRTPESDAHPGGTLVVRACDDPEGRMSMILSHLNHRELKVLMECIGTSTVPARKTA